MNHDNGRDNKGRFAEGNPGGPGRPRRRVEDDYLASLCDEIPLGLWREIVQRAANDARNGDHRAREWISRYLLPVPAQRVRNLQQLTVAEIAGLDRVLEDVEMAELRKTLMQPFTKISG